MRVAQASLQRSEAALRRSNETLEERVAERTLAFEAEQVHRRAAEEKLRQSQKMDAIGQLTGGIAHDFNNLLTWITGSLDIIRRRMASGRTDDIPRFMDAASTSAQRAAALTHRLLAFSRRQSLDTKPCDVNALIASLDDMLRRTLGEQVHLEISLAAGLWPALTDANQFENALLNLAINARDAMADGGRLGIDTSNATLGDADDLADDDVAGGSYVMVRVADTGAGKIIYISKSRLRRCEIAFRSQSDLAQELMMYKLALLVKVFAHIRQLDLGSSRRIPISKKIFINVGS